MTNWKENIYPFKDFNETTTELWKVNGFDKATVRKWLESGLQPLDYDFAEWLVKKKSITPQELLENHDYDVLREEWFGSIFNGEKTSINVATLENEGKRVEFWDTSNLEKNFVFDREKESRKIELLKQLDKGKKIRTTITEIDPMYWGDIRFTIDKEDRFRDWVGTEGCVTFFTKDIAPFNTWEVGDLIEIDVERLNSEKYTVEPLKSEDKDIVKLIEKKEKEVKVKDKKLNKQAKLRLKIKEQGEEIEKLKEELSKEREARKKLIEEFNVIQKKYSEYIESNTVMLFK